MEVSVRDMSGVPGGSILSVRAGNVRRQGPLVANKPMRFSMSPGEACPFTVDLFAPIASSRLTLKPDGGLYTVPFEPAQGFSLPTSTIELSLGVNSISAATAENTAPRTPSRQQQRLKNVSEAQAYIEKHSLAQYVQNLMQSLLKERPDDPWMYMKRHLDSSRAEAGSGPPPKPIAKPAVPAPKVEAPQKVAPKPLERDFEGPAFAISKPDGEIRELRPLKATDLVPAGSTLRRMKLRNLSEVFPSKNAQTPLMEVTSNFQTENSWVTQTLFSSNARTYFQMCRAGPRKILHFAPNDVVAAIVTCGGLCPGLNSVIREIVLMLYMYGAKKIFGVPGGYKGLTQPHSWLELDPAVVEDIHNQGGTMLVSDRGNPPVQDMANALKEMGVNQYYIVGGDGTHRGAYATYEALQGMGYECAVVGVPKTIDNDVPMLDRTFGFDTACTEAIKAIDSAYVEAKCNANCIGMVKLMGRHCGFIAMNACLAARYVDICLLPEMEISLPKVLKYCLDVMQNKGSAVLVVAEGCGDTLVKSSGEKDDGGNVKLADVGTWLRDKILARFKEVKLPLTIKYIDPTYMVRAVKPNSNDSVYSSVLAQNAVHAAMAGATGVTVGRVLQRYVMLPMQAITQQHSKRVDLTGRWFARLVSATLQPDFSPDEAQVQIPTSRTVGILEIPEALLACTDQVDLMSNIHSGDEIRRLELQNLSEPFGFKKFQTTLDETIQGASIGFVSDDHWVTQTLGNRSPGVTGAVKLQMLQAGPRRDLFFQPAKVAAAIVTCGGLCPGLNSVIREIVMMLYSYGVKKVYGIRGGWKGVVMPKSWLTLNPENCKDIHMKGGSILVADRGNPTPDEMAETLKSRGVQQFYVIGGDGTHRCAQLTYEATTRIAWECSVVGIPKTIDNDISLLDRTFGFDTAVTEATRSIDTAFVEATGNGNCIGMVRLMGRHCGYLTMMAVLAARQVDICLLPEMDITLEKVLDHCVYLLNNQGYAVVVVAEGCGDTMLQGSGDTDAGGNKKLADVGPWLKDKVLARFKELKKPLTIKYVDPTYTVRAIPANPNDSIYCSVLASGAVHGAMAGYTGITVAKVDESFVWLPIGAITNRPNRHVDLKDRWYERLLATTQQPNLGATGSELAKPVNPKLDVLQQRKSVRRLSSMAHLRQGLEEITVPDTHLVVVEGYSGKEISSRQLERADILKDDDLIRKLACFHLSERFGATVIPSTLKTSKGPRVVFADNFAWATQAITFGSRLDSGGKGEPYYQMVRAGPREVLHFDPQDPHACAAIVSCGGICPGLNSVIREIVMTLWSYGVRRIYGIKGGYKGVVEPDSWIELTPDIVADIHMNGGTMLVSDRGNPPIPDMAAALKSKNVRQYFVLGGDGTHKGAMLSFEECLKLEHECAVVGVPKTIDNDVPILDQTFGFDTACTEAVNAVDSAYVEATCNANCIGLVKLMGRHCGFIAMYACLAARHADICLLPEMDIDVEKVLQHAVHLMKTKRHAVIVVAEGCGDTMIKSSGETDAGGNKLLADAGLWLKDTITKRFKQLDMPLTIKYIDPTYMIRSLPANAFDSTYCSTLAQNAVHAAMAGYSGITVGKVSERYVYLPIHAITMQKGRRVNPAGRWFARLEETTRQPDFKPDGAKLDTEPKDHSIMLTLSQPAGINDVLKSGDQVRRLQVVNLREKFTPVEMPNPCPGCLNSEVLFGPDSWSMKTLRRLNKQDDRGAKIYQMLRSGPRPTIHFDPAKCAAVIVTCGGICPGLNSVIREIVMTLKGYGVPRVYGCKGGYKGMVEVEQWIELTPEVVKNIHMQGGTILVSDRGNPPHIEIAKCMQSQRITHCFVLGGDGTHRGAMDIFKCMQDIGHECSVVGVPKTIDNDIPILDRSFGFKTASEEAKNAIDAALTEASCNSNCISLVKLMGRHCGFIALEATLAARHVDMCLLPEMTLSLPKVLTHALHLIRTKGNAVLVVAEGCGDTLIKSSGDTDAGGNKKLADVGTWLKSQLEEYFKKMLVPMTLMYFDPTYMIRAVPANPNDSVFCSVLGQQAVHGAMAGYSGFTVGKVDERYVMLPIHAITNTPPRRVDLLSNSYARLMASTGQPNLAPGIGDEWALMEAYPDPASEPQTFTEQGGPELDVDAWQKMKRQVSTMLVPEDPKSEVNAILKVVDGYGTEKEQRTLSVGDVISGENTVRKLMVMHLSDKYGVKRLPSPLQGMLNIPFTDAESFSTEAVSTTERVDSGKGQPFYQLVCAGPHEYIHFNPKDTSTCAVIVTVGNVCPGENAAIRELVMTFYRYGVERVFGVPNGFKGVLDQSSWIRLDPQYVQDIHEKGGSILQVSRGNPPHSAIADALKANNVRQFMVIGGDGAMKGCLQVLTALTDIEHECACIGIPATVDNDLPLVDVTFGFNTACTVAREAIDAAYVEATCNANCIGFVKVDGRQTGFLALHTTLASRHVDICLLPEMEISLPKVLKHCEHLMQTKKYAVVLVADGAKESLFRLAGEKPEHGDVGIWLKDRILAHFKANFKPLTIKYIDPTHMVRTAKPNASDSVYTSYLAEQAVHAAMAGYTATFITKLYDKTVLTPIQAISQSAARKVNMRGRWIARLLFTTKQPDFEPDGFVYKPTESEDLMNLSTNLKLAAVLREGSTIQRLECANLGQKFTCRNVESPIARSMSKAFLGAGDWSLQTFQRRNSAEITGRRYLQLMRSGPRPQLHFDPQEPGTAAAIVNCGGLCPGLNSVIRELANMLKLYGVKTVYGIIGGYKGCVKDDEWIELTDSVIQDIHLQGGSILVADRGNPPHSEIAKVLQRRNIRQYFVLGGDGTHAGALSTFNEMTGIGHECAVVGIPKTIDNDIQIIDRSFGFDTACTEAKRAIDSAYVEATTNANCVGLVKLMGRHCGWIALQATLAARYVDVCLIPEMNISLSKLLDYIGVVMRRQKRAVIVVAEGCGDTIIQSTGERDAGGNKLLADVGIFMKDQITSYCKSNGIPITVKYIDPTYMIRSVPPNAQDSELCSMLAQQAVHSAMAGYTGITVGKVDERFVMLPIHAITQQGPRKVDLDSIQFEALMATTLQPRFDP